ncbi:DNA-binding PadR family transcriptional regulator [Saccharothrix tamanrassetensis]|uniref:DNA-binding PadR family transcriptional regulator n=1 Tax=Saccharothrix tamanrassetensis TaxID=1051531 RepID=A0A841C4V0_9PSEU|nr:PadR family transcriptional regulator [Saccharothrix tamanrassetensis]MBB5953552.1 DNA-binding PadR family transcriptional regulator [Saccharothrix tamanrassetensis]
MSATRLLVLGVVRGYGRAHGYLIGNDLMSWGAGEWANVKWGSIYHALKQLTKDGCLTDETVPPARTDYVLTAKGEQEFRRLLRDALRRPETRPDMLAAGLALLPSLTRADAVALLHERLAALESRRDTAREQAAGWGEPAHVRELFGLWEHTAGSGVAWTRGLLERLEAGAYPMAGDRGSPGGPGSWSILKLE